MDPEPNPRPAPSQWAVAAVVLCGVCAFLGLYCTQPLLPLLEAVFHASKTMVSLTVSAATLGVPERSKLRLSSTGETVSTSRISINRSTISFYQLLGTNANRTSVDCP